jgi:hypothetical protein
VTLIILSLGVTIYPWSLNSLPGSMAAKRTGNILYMHTSTVYVIIKYIFARFFVLRKFQENSVALVYGVSGTGKTTLVNQLKKKPEILFISGKFSVDKNFPYSALREAASSLIEQVFRIMGNLG